MRGRSVLAAIALAALVVVGGACAPNGQGEPTTSPSVRIAPNILRDRIVEDIEYWRDRGIKIAVVRLTSGGSNVLVTTPVPIVRSQLCGLGMGKKRR